MLIRAACFLLAMAGASPALAQIGAPVNLSAEALEAMPAEARGIAVAVRDFGECIQTRIAPAAANSDATTIARAAVAACATEKAAIERAMEAMIASPQIPADEKAEARAGFQRQFASVEETVTAQVRARQSGTGGPVEPAPPESEPAAEDEPETPLPGRA